MSSWQDLKERVSVSQVLELCGIDPPERIPGLIRCPFHDDDTPSLNVDETLWYCHGCGTGGDIFNFVQAMGSSPSHAAHLLERAFAGDLEGMPRLEAKVEPPPADFRDTYGNSLRYPLINERVAYQGESWYNLDRWLGEKWPTGLVTIKDLHRWGCRLDKWNLFIPHYAPTGELTGIKVRCMVPPNIGAKSAVKGSQFRQLYSVHQQPGWSLHDHVILCEGESDTWTMEKWTENEKQPIDVYGLPGVQSWPRHLQQLVGYKVVYLALDRDGAGKTAAYRITSTLIEMGLIVVPLGSAHAHGKDVTEAYAAGWRPTLAV